MGDNMNIFHYNSTSSSDEMSHFVRQISVRSSSSSVMGHGGPQTRGFNSYSHGLSPSHGGLKQGISRVDGCERRSSGSGGGLLGNDASCSVGGSEINDTDEYDCESEEYLEAMIDEAPAKPALPRGSSKRSRAAEIHNLSEKRRRSRINEKMKALQNLIPNSNKTDKASMLDEAIEYLQQLQLQVQMLTMRNGLSLHPMGLPAMLPSFQLSQTRTNFGEEHGSLHMNSSGTLALNQETSEPTIFSLPNQCNTSNHLPTHNMSSIINSETSFEGQFGPFQHLTSSQDICREDVLRHYQRNMKCSKTNPSEFDDIGTSTSVSVPFDGHVSDLIGRDHDLMLSSRLMSGMQAGSSPDDDTEMERRTDF